VRRPARDLASPSSPCASTRASLGDIHKENAILNAPDDLWFVRLPFLRFTWQLSPRGKDDPSWGKRRRCHVRLTKPVRSAPRQHRFAPWEQSAAQLVRLRKTRDVVLPRLPDVQQPPGLPGDVTPKPPAEDSASSQGPLRPPDRCVHQFPADASPEDQRLPVPHRVSERYSWATARSGRKARAVFRSGIARVVLVVCTALVLATPILSTARILHGVLVFLLMVLGLAGVVFSARGLLRSWT
jgi:hypothetical protein